MYFLSVIDPVKSSFLSQPFILINNNNNIMIIIIIIMLTISIIFFINKLLFWSERPLANYTVLCSVHKEGRGLQGGL